MIRSLVRPIFPRLSMRLALTMALACLPVGLVTYLQTSALEDEMRMRVEEGLLGNTLRAAEAKISMIREAQGLMAGVAQALPLVMEDPARCSLLLRKVEVQYPIVAHVGFITADGKLLCSNQNKSADFSKNIYFQKVRDAQAPYLLVNPVGQVSGQSVLIISHPVFDAAGTYLGYTSMSVPHAKLVAMFPTAESATDAAPHQTTRQPLLYWTFDGDGNVLTASIDLDKAAKRLPTGVDLKSLVDSPAQVFEGVSKLGFKRTYAVVPVLHSELYLMSMWTDTIDGLVDQFRVVSYLSPALMWLAAFLVSAIAAERLVARHVRTLHRAIRAFARGDRRLESLDLADAPIELRELGNSYLAMTESITRGEADLEDTVHQKEVLLREVHHRVKNNLQLIASIMNIQMRKSTSVEAKSLLKDLHDRVMSLSTIHRGLYVTSGQGDVSAAELLPDITRQLSALAVDPDRSAKVTLDIDDIRLVPDQAVPLSLLLTEALTRAIKQSDKPAEIRVALKRGGIAGNQATLSIISTLAADPPPSPDAGLGQQLITAFSQQLRGKLATESNGITAALHLTFDVAPLSAGEQRRGGEADEVPA